MSNRAPKFEAKAQPDGRIAYTVAGMVTVYDIQEAIDLMHTGAFQIRCALTRGAIEPKHSTRVISDAKGMLTETYEV